ncbi:hypothetical protein [Endozoicomonas sp. SCSIO W0465]|uniref:hypothetical protein n=1 Tax=Endozoicomonas sp. SCSIO W0465 TaxID=2918516 RepID=UPI002075164D|nr:hypothetical protein [Endozoicomonas sp. SCSIO W0465]USE36918.1 hypothetical protein MJO57_01355 [Endozoicomonas sp. SCSIO W0465]
MIDPIEQGINPNPQCAVEIEWPLSDRPNQSLDQEVYLTLKARHPDIDLDREMVSAFHYMLNEFAAPSDASGVKKFLDGWMHTNQKYQQQRNQADRYFPVKGGER